MDRPAIPPFQSNQDLPDSDEPHAKRQAQLSTWTNRRTRVTQACDRCRERKRQCDYLLPRCGRCQKVDKDCTFFAVQKTRGRPLGSSNTNKSTHSQNSHAKESSFNNKINDARISKIIDRSHESNEPQDQQEPYTVLTSHVVETAGASSWERAEHSDNITSAPILAASTHHIPNRDKNISMPTRNTPAMSFTRRSSLVNSRAKAGQELPDNTRPASAATTQSSASAALTTINLYSKEVTDELIVIFFEYFFLYFNFFDPVAFLRDYEYGTADPLFVNAIYAVSARYSTHPVISTSPPYLSGEPYAVLVRDALSRQIISNVTMTHIHTAFLLSFYEYSCGRSLQGYHFMGIAFRMAPELCFTRSQLNVQKDEDGEDHYSEDEDEQESRNYNFGADTRSPDQNLEEPMESTKEQIRIRTFFFIIAIDIMEALISGHPPTFDLTSIQLSAPPSDRIDWWMKAGHEEIMTRIIEEPSISLSPSSLGQEHSSTYGRTYTTRIANKLSTTNANPRLISDPGQILSKPPSTPFHSALKTNYSSFQKEASTLSATSSIYNYSTPTRPQTSMSSTSRSLFLAAPFSTAIIAGETITGTTRPFKFSSLSLFSQGIIRKLNHPKGVVLQQTMGYYATIIPISAAVLKFSKPGPMPETNEAMAPKNITSNLHHVSYSVESQRDKRLVTDSQLSNAQPTYATATTSNGAKKASLRVCQNRTEFYFIDHPTQTVSETDETTATLENTNHESLHSSRTSKRRRINTIFTSNERKIEFERVDQELSKWAEQLPEMYKPDRAGHLLEQLDINSISLVIFHYLLVMVLHHPVMMIAKLTSNRCRQGALGKKKRTEREPRESIGRRANERRKEGTSIGGSSTGRNEAREQGIKGIAGIVIKNHIARTNDLAETVNRIHAKDIDDGHAIKEAYSETNHADMDMSLRVKSNARKMKKGKEENENDYSSDETDDCRIIRRSTQQCDEAADGITSIIKNFDKDYVKYHGGHHNLPVYLAGTILIMRLSRTDDPMVQSQIQEQLQICSTFLSIAAPYWKEAGEKANALLDQLANYSKRRYTGSDEDEGDEIEDEEEDKDDNDSFDQRGGDVEEEDSTDENNGAEQSLQDLMIADALLDLSNRPPRTDYSFRKAMSLPTLQSPPSIQLTPSMRISRSEPSLSECCQMKTERQSPFRQQPPVLTIPLNASHCRSPLSSTSLPLTHPLSLNSPISQTVIAAKTIANMDSSSLLCFTHKADCGLVDKNITGGIRRHTVSTGACGFRKTNKTRTLSLSSLPSPPLFSLSHCPYSNTNSTLQPHYLPNYPRQTITQTEDITLVSLENLRIYADKCIKGR